jgi:hypothetical protein
MTTANPIGLAALALMFGPALVAVAHADDEYGAGQRQWSVTLPAA